MRSSCAAHGRAGQKLGIWGFGAAAHVLCQIAVWQGREVFAFTRNGDDKVQAFARGFGACWAGPSEMLPPAQLDASVIFAPVGVLVPTGVE